MIYYLQGPYVIYIVHDRMMGEKLQHRVYLLSGISWTHFSCRLFVNIIRDHKSFPFPTRNRIFHFDSNLEIVAMADANIILLFVCVAMEMVLREVFGNLFYSYQNIDKIIILIFLKTTSAI